MKLWQRDASKEGDSDLGTASPISVFLFTYLDEDFPHHEGIFIFQIYKSNVLCPLFPLTDDKVYWHNHAFRTKRSIEEKY